MCRAASPPRATPRALAERHLLTRLPVPYPTRDRDLLAPVGSATLTLFPLLGGNAPPEPFPADLQAERARTIAQLHRATPRLHDVIPAPERFAIPFETDLRTGLARLEQPMALDRPGVHALRTVVVPRRDEIERQLARLQTL